MIVWKYRNDKIHGKTKQEEYNQRKGKQRKTINKMYKKRLWHNLPTPMKPIHTEMWNTERTRNHSSGDLDRTSQKQYEIEILETNKLQS